jgi:hypothetical protein
MTIGKGGKVRENGLAPFPLANCGVDATKELLEGVSKSLGAATRMIDVLSGTH